MTRTRHLMGKEPGTRRFCCSYHHDGAEWAVIIDAYDWDDAEARVKKLGWLRLDGELGAVIPARLGWLAKAICWMRNFFKGGSNAI